MKIKLLFDDLLRDHSVVRVNPVIQSLVPRFLENRRRDVIALEGALGDQDFVTIQSIGHAIKGTGGGYGFEAISAIGNGIEEAGAAKDGAGATQWIAALRTYLERVEVLYETE